MSQKTKKRRRLRRRKAATDGSCPRCGQPKDTVRGSRCHKCRIRNAVQKAIKDGRITKKPCQICGEQPTEFHHTHGYKDTNRYKGVFLCAKHHRQADHKIFVDNTGLKNESPSEINR